jgi:hypothetical protein
MTVKNFRKQHIERILYITPDGMEVILHDPPEKSVLSYEGDGLPSPEYDTTRGPFQHGMNVLGMREPIREIDLVLRWNACNRDEYWDMRHNLINLLRPNRTDVNNSSPGVLRRILSNGKIFDLDCYLTKGPDWVYPRKWDHWSIQESLKFTAFNPILYNPTLKSGLVQDFTPATDPDIIIPLDFEFIFGETSPAITKSITVNYLGNWESFPTIIVAGPYEGISIQHQTTFGKVALSGYSSPTGETTTIDLTYGRKTILTNSGISLLGYVTNDSDLSEFSIQPDPLVPGSINIFDITVISGSSDTLVQLQYKDRYIGI